jgi:HEAT repeat protein
VVEPIARRLLVDPNDGVRFAVAVIVGKRRLTGCADLVEPLAVDPSDSVRAAALYALVRLGRVVDLTPLAQLAASPNERTRSNALFVLGELRNASAIPLVESVVTRRLEDEDPARRRVVDLQAAEAMAKMGDYRQYDPIRAALYAPPEQGEVVALACQMIGEADDRGARQHLIGLWNEKGPLARPLEIRLIAGASLARIGEPNLEPVIVVAEAALTDPSPSIRAQAVATLGWVGGDRALVAIAPLLSDPVPLVRLAAAVASLRAAKPR